MPSTTGIHVLPDVDLDECDAHYFIDCGNSSKNDPISRFGAFAPRELEKYFVIPPEENKTKSEQTGARRLLLANDVRPQFKGTVLEGLGGCFVLARPEKGALGIQKQPNPEEIYRDITQYFDEAILHHDSTCDKTTGNDPDNTSKRNSIEVAIKLPPRPSRRTVQAVMDAIFAGYKKAVDANLEPNVGIVGSNKKLDRLIQREKQTWMKRIQQEALALRDEADKYRNDAAKELANPAPCAEKWRDPLADSLVSSIFALDQAASRFTILALNSAENVEVAAEFKEAAIKAKRDAVRPTMQYAKLLDARAKTTEAGTNKMANSYRAKANSYAISTDYENWSAERLQGLCSHAETYERVNPSSMSETWKTISNEYLLLADLTSSASKADEYRGLAAKCLNKVSPHEVPPTQVPPDQLETLMEESADSLREVESSDQVLIHFSGETEVVDAPAIDSRTLSPEKESREAEKLVNYAIGTAISECADLLPHRHKLNDGQAKTVVAAINQILAVASKFDKKAKKGDVSMAAQAVYRKAAMRSSAQADAYSEYFAKDIETLGMKTLDLIAPDSRHIVMADDMKAITISV